jgi:hypothetical protein
VPLARYSLCLYGPPVRLRIWLHSTPDERGNIEYGPTPVRSSISRAVMLPSRSTASFARTRWSRAWMSDRNDS